jgi:hypothetical protein
MLPNATENKTPKAIRAVRPRITAEPSAARTSAKAVVVRRFISLIMQDKLAVFNRQAKTFDSLRRKHELQIAIFSIMVGARSHRSDRYSVACRSSTRQGPSNNIMHESHGHWSSR